MSCSNECATTESYTIPLLESSYGNIPSCSWPNHSSDVVKWSLRGQQALWNQATYVSSRSIHTVHCSDKNVMIILSVGLLRELSRVQRLTQQITGYFRDEFSQSITWPVQNTQPSRSITRLILTKLHMTTAKNNIKTQNNQTKNYYVTSFSSCFLASTTRTV